MILSPNFSLHEFTRSATAIRLGISNVPTAEHLENIKLLTVNVLQPLRDHFGVPIRITSGYRSWQINKAVGGSKTSQHSHGQAVDISGSPSNAQMFDFIRKNFKFDQLIWEFGTKTEPDWVHVSFVKNRSRRQVLKAVKFGKKTIYTGI